MVRKDYAEVRKRAEVLEVDKSKQRDVDHVRLGPLLPSSVSEGAMVYVLGKLLPDHQFARVSTSSSPVPK